MNFSFNIEIAIMIIVIIQFIVLIIFLAKNKQGSQDHVLQKLIEYDKRLDKNESGLRHELEIKFGQNRGELASSLKSGHEQLSNTITNFTGLVDNKIKSILDTLTASSKANRDELTKSIIDFEKQVTTGLDKNRETVEKKLSEIQTGNEAKLDKMRETVDEKLQKTLEARLSSSFQMVKDDLEKVQKGLVEMQSLASDVGDLKKVMSNVKTKGVLGEYQLEAILEEILLQSQYEKNVKTKIGSDNHVEFAVKIPSKENSSKPIWLPIDSKLPATDYEALVDAYDNGDKKNLETAKKAFSKTVKNFAKEIHDKYIDPPNTTDFALMFLPFEGEYAEVVRDPELFESIRRESKIIVTGPSTIAALLNALRVGFSSIAVDKNTSLIRELLSSVKKEFGNFETVLVKVKEKIDDAGKTLEEKVGVRTRAIKKALNRVETVSDDTAGQKLITDASFDLDDSEKYGQNT
jgi:DNA recombination protein RmuC